MPYVQVFPRTEAEEPREGALEEGASEKMCPFHAWHFFFRNVQFVFATPEILQF
jgi:hypothetical protein